MKQHRGAVLSVSARNWLRKAGLCCYFCLAAADSSYWFLHHKPNPMRAESASGEGILNSAQALVESKEQ